MPSAAENARQRERLPRRTATLWEGEGGLPTCEAALNHRVIDVLVSGSCDFLCFLCAAGFDFFDEALAVESDYFH